MREIKFRAWDTAAERMVDSPYRFEPMADYFRTEYKCDGDYVTWETWQDEDDGRGFPGYIMQFTGLKDKNGKEIYDGDVIVQDEYPFFDEGERNYVGLVEWIFGGWQVVLKCVNWDRSGISDGINSYIDGDGEGGKHFEVIGNIYEHPHLLNPQP